MKENAVILAKRSGMVAVLALASALASCSGNRYGDGSIHSSPTISFATEPTTIVLGQSATLTWSSGQGTTCAASGAWDGTVPAAGSADVTPPTTGAITYTLTCSDGTYSGSAIKSVTLTVEPPSVYTMTSLIESYADDTAVTTDAHLVNPWGITFGPTTTSAVANNHTGTVTLYSGSGQVSPLVVQIETSVAAMFGATGIAFNSRPDLRINASDFLVSSAGQTAPAALIFDGEGGMIAAWTPLVDITQAFTMYTDSNGAVYKGLALANNGEANFLYATDFANGKIDVFDSTFAKQAPSLSRFSFDDPALPEGYAPFGIQAIGNGPSGTTRIFVSYAKRDESEPRNELFRAGFGIINVFDANGNLLKHLVPEGGKLDAPWGMALAPADFGTLSNALLVGNVGDGSIQGYDPSSGRYLGTISNAAGAPFTVPGLRGIAFGNDALNQPLATLFFAAGTNGGTNGLYGRIDLGEAMPALGHPPFLQLTAPDGDLSGIVTLTADVGGTRPITKVEFFLNGSMLIGTVTSPPFSLEWNTATVSDGDATLRAVATDDNGNVGSSQILVVSIANTNQ